MRNKRVKKYLLFMFGAWIRLEDNIELYEHIKDVLETILATPELSFVTGEHTLIACIESTSPLNEIKDLLDEFLKPEVPAYFLMPKPRNLAYRLNPILEKHLFSKRNIKKEDAPNPEVLKELMEYFKKRAMDNLEFFEDKLDLEFIEKISKEDLEDNFNRLENETLDIDSILDKINEEGLNSLTINEKRFLDKQKNDKDNTIH
jgi:hypothetical protein|tara:strand:- start:12433 stop:13041 length:609 start_codon:yes stop_codon:yes gene_type:complete